MSVLTDAASYFSALRDSLLQARRSIFIVGWDIDSRTPIVGEAPHDDDAPSTLGPLLRWLAGRRRRLNVRILLWDYSLLYALEREPFVQVSLGWRTRRRVRVRFDSDLPLGACQHEKLVVIDDAVAYCGGIDLTSRRWDTARHTATDPRRLDPAGEAYGPIHDVQVVVDGEAAIALGEHARMRWRAAGKGNVPSLQAVGDPWPRHVAPQLSEVDLGIARTAGAVEGQRELREVEALTLRAIEEAQRFVYIENQYITATNAAQALAQRMVQVPALEAVVVTSKTSAGWLEAQAMGSGRVRFMQHFESPELRSRIRFVYPYVIGNGDETPIQIHSKVLAVDDGFLKIGSSNLNNRSMGFDTECDLAAVARTADHRRQLKQIRDAALAEHLGAQPADIERAMARPGWLQRLERLGSETRGLRSLPHDDTEVTEVSEVIVSFADPERVLDPEELVGDMLGAKRHGVGLRRLRRLAVAALVLLGLIAAWHFSPLGDAVDPDSLTNRLRTLRDSAWAAPLVLAAFVVGSMIAFPVTVLIAVTAVLLGPLKGFLWASIGTMIGALVSYQLGRLLGRGLLRDVLGRKLARIDRELRRRGVVSVALLRSVPIAPFTVVNLAMGASSVRFWDYMLGTLLGMLPGIAAIALLGDRLATAWTHPNLGNVTLMLVALVLWITIVLVAQRLVSRLGAE